MELKMLIWYAEDEVLAVRKAREREHDEWDAGGAYLRGLERMALSSLGHVLLISEGHLHHTTEDAARAAEKHMEAVSA